MAKQTALGTVGKGRRGIGPLGWALRGAAAGAAGTAALNAVTHLDVLVRGRAADSVPQETVEELVQLSQPPVFGDRETRANRMEGLGPLAGLGGGVAVGVATGLLRAAGLRSRTPVGILLVALGAILPANGPRAVLGIADPRNWSSTSWLTDVVPYVAYGAVVKTTMDAFDRP